MKTNREKFLTKYKVEDKPYSLEEVASITKMPEEALQEVYNRGIGAWKTNISSVRLQKDFSKNPDTKKYPRSKRLPKEMWAMARVFSFVMKTPSTFRKADKDIAEKYGLLQMKGSGVSEYDELFGGRNANPKGTAFLRKRMKIMDATHGEYSPEYKDELAYWKEKKPRGEYSEHIQKDVGGEETKTKFIRPKKAQTKARIRHRFFLDPANWGIDKTKLKYHERTNKSYIKDPSGPGYWAFPPVMWKGHYALAHYHKMPPDETREEQKEEEGVGEGFEERALREAYEKSKQRHEDLEERFEKRRRDEGQTYQKKPYESFTDWKESLSDWYKKRTITNYKYKMTRSDYNSRRNDARGAVGLKSRVGAHYDALAFHPEDMPEDEEERPAAEQQMKTLVRKAILHNESQAGDVEDEFKFPPPREAKPQLTKTTNFAHQRGHQNKG